MRPANDIIPQILNQDPCKFRCPAELLMNMSSVDLDFTIVFTWIRKSVKLPDTAASAIAFSMDVCSFAYFRLKRNLWILHDLAAMDVAFDVRLVTALLRRRWRPPFHRSLDFPFFAPGGCQDVCHLMATPKPAPQEFLWMFSLKYLKGSLRSVEDC